MAKQSDQKNIDKILELLAARYPVAVSQLSYDNPWQLLVAVILSAQCADARVNMVTPGFFRLWPGPAELAAASLEEIENVIRSTGFFRNKAKNLLGSAKMAHDLYGDQLPASMEDLLKFPGVARKTANVVLFAGFGINAGIAVDTHVKRISHRLGLTANTDPVKVEKDLMELLDQREWGDFNHRLVWFGRDVCKARKPACGQCEMAVFCPKLEPPKS